MGSILTLIIVPPLIHSALLLSAIVIITALLYGSRPTISQQTVFATIPWIVSGAILNVFYQVGDFLQTQIYPPWVAPVFSAPSIYLTTYIGFGVVLLISTVFRTQSPSERRDWLAMDVAAVGLGMMLSLLAIYVWQAMDPIFEPLTPIAPLGGLIASLVISFILYILIGAWRAYIIADARFVGWLVLFGHVFDAVTVTIGYDVIGLRGFPNIVGIILGIAKDLPTYSYLGAGWLFVLAKIVIAFLFIVIFASYVSKHKTRGNLLFAVAGVVGLAPALNNFLLYILSL